MPTETPPSPGLAESLAGPLYLSPSELAERHPESLDRIGEFIESFDGRNLISAVSHMCMIAVLQDQKPDLTGMAMANCRKEGLHLCLQAIDLLRQMKGMTQEQLAALNAPHFPDLHYPTGHEEYTQ